MPIILFLAIYRKSQPQVPHCSPPLRPLGPPVQVGGYVKGAGKMGGFVCLARDCDARVRLGQLADKFVDDPAGEFPPGKRVAGKVLHVEGGRSVSVWERLRGRMHCWVALGWEARS